MGSHVEVAAAHAKTIAPVSAYSLLLVHALESLHIDRAALSTAALDLGTGSGVLARKLCKMGFATVVVSDILPEPVQYVQAALAAEFPLNIVGRVGDLWVPHSTDKFGLILCNPPSLPCRPDALEFPERVWYDGGPDGRRIIDRILDAAPRHLITGGILLIAQTSLANVDATERRCQTLGLEVRRIGEVTLPFRKFYERCLPAPYLLNDAPQTESVYAIAMTMRG